MKRSFDFWCEYLFLPLGLGSSQRVGRPEREGRLDQADAHVSSSFGECEGRIIQNIIRNAFDHMTDSLIIYFWPY